MAASNMKPENAANSEAPWYAAYPPPVSEAVPVSRTEVLGWLQKQSKGDSGRDVVLVDLRRNDHEGGTIRGSINLPAQSLYPTIPTLYAIFAAASVKRVVWYCGSSSGRGPRAAAWFADHLRDKENDLTMQSLVLEGGIKGWAKAGEDYTQWMDEYEESVWQK